MTDRTDIPTQPVAATPSGGVLYVGPPLGRSLLGIAKILAFAPRGG